MPARQQAAGVTCYTDDARKITLKNMSFVLGFIILILGSSGIFIYFLLTKQKKSLYLIPGLWGTAILFNISASIFGWTSRPLQLTKEEIVGEYHIDKAFYPGENADWQFDHYKFKITPEDSILFYAKNKDSSFREFKSHIKYSSGPPDIWALSDTINYHVIKHPPILFRGHNKYFYVFHSEIYGNMFFRKND